MNLVGEQTIELSVEPPDPAKIPKESDILGVTVLMITALYRRQEFFRCSYFIYNNYEDESLAEKSDRVVVDQVVRSVLIDKPRIRLYEIMWDYSTTVRLVPENVTRLVKGGPPHRNRGEAKDHKRQKICKKKRR